MYSYEEIMKAIELYIKYDRSIADTIVYFDLKRPLSRRDRATGTV